MAFLITVGRKEIGPTDLFTRKQIFDGISYQSFAVWWFVRNIRTTFNVDVSTAK